MASLKSFVVLKAPFQGEDWDSRRKSLPRGDDGLEDDFVDSPEWQTYLQHRPDNFFFCLVVDDRETFSVRSRTWKDGTVAVTAGVPAEMFLCEESKQDVCRDVVMRTYTWASEKFGWPPPPPLPPLTAKRTYRKNYRPPED